MDNSTCVHAVEKLSWQQRKRLTFSASVSFVPKLSASAGLDWNWVFLHARVAYNNLQKNRQRAHAVYRGPSQFRFFFLFFFLRSTLETTLVVIVSVGNPLRLFLFCFGTEAAVVRARPDFRKEVNSGLIKGGH